MDHPRLFVACLLFSLVILAVAAEADAAEGGLLARHASLDRTLASNAYGMPMHVESRTEGDAREGEVVGVLDAPYAQVRAMATSTAAWCALATLHPNVKACVDAETERGCTLDVYVGTRRYQDPAEAHQTRLAFRPVHASSSTLDVRLEASEGPYGTSDYRLTLEAAPLDAHRTVVRLRYGYVAGFQARFASGLYFATVGHDKVGFTEVDTVEGRRPVRGPRGAIERNAVRYFLAVRAHLEADASQEDRQARWLALRDRFSRQLDELDGPAYREAKRRERDRAGVLRQAAGAGCEGQRRQVATHAVSRG